MLATWGTSTGRNPTLDLQFAGATSLDNRITFSRGTTATYFNSAGVLTTAGTAEARFDYNPSTLAAQGLLIEEQRTNSVSNNTMQGAVAGTPGTAPTNWSVSTTGSGITREIVGTGTENGITYIDIKFSGTASATTAFTIFPAGVVGAVAASSGQTWTNSLWVKIVAGGTSQFFIAMQEFDSGSNFLRGPATSQALTSTLTRYTQTVTIGASTASIRSGGYLSVTNTEVVNITLRIGLPQLELGAFATSVIPTTTTALTRSADVATMTGTNFSSWFNATAGTLSITGSTFGSATTNRRMAFMTDGSTNNRIGLLFNASNRGQFLVVSSSSVVASPENTVVAITSPSRIAAAYALDDYAMSINGAAVVTDNSGALPSGVNQMSIGSQLSNEFVNGYIQRISYYPVRLPNSTLQALTG